MWQTKAKAFELVGRMDDAKKSWGRAADETKKSVRSPTDKGRLLARAYYMFKAGRDVAEIDAIYADLAKRFPDEYTYHYKRADILHKVGEHAKARPFAEQALPLAYGANLASTAILLAKILKAEGKPAEASKIANDAIEKLGEPVDNKSVIFNRVRELKTFLR
jgi:tetratricopeptide (TPR) repeat protein